MQILHPFEGSVQAYAQQLGEADRYRPAGCPLCGAKKALIAHGFYGRSVVAEGFDGWIRVRRYLCRLCQRTSGAGKCLQALQLNFAIARRRTKNDEHCKTKFEKRCRS